MLATLIIIIVSLIVGFIAHKYSAKNHSLAQKMAEKVLEAQGIDIDFSADDKKGK